MNSNDQTPYTSLDPNLILNAVESMGFHCTGSLLALNSYENRVYQIGIEGAPPLIAKFYRPKRWSDEAILEEHAFALQLVEHEIPIVAPWQSDTQETLFEYQAYRFALFKRWGGRPLELDRLDQLAWMGRFIGRVHAIGATKTFAHRPLLTIETYGHEALAYLYEHSFIPGYLKEKIYQSINTLLKNIEDILAKVGSVKTIRLHGDMHAGNVLWDDAGPHIVDLDDCLQGPAVQDIWMLLSGDKMQQKSQLDYILEGYNEFYDFNLRELHLIEALRALRQIHYCGWLAKRWHDPTFPLNFPWFNTVKYWEEFINDLYVQNQSLLETLEEIA